MRSPPVTGGSLARIPPKLTLFVLAGAFTGISTANAEPLSLTAAIPRSATSDYGLGANGRPAGFAVDALDAIAARAGIAIDYRIAESWGDAMQAVRDGRADLIPTLGITPSHTAEFAFTSPIDTLTIALFVRRESLDIGSRSDLDGRRVAVVSGDDGAASLRVPNKSERVVFADPQEALFALLSGRSDALVYPERVIWRLSREAGVADRIRRVGPPLAEIPHAIAVRGDNAPLLDLLEPQVQAFLDSADYHTIFDRWLASPPPFWTPFRVAIVMGLLLLTMVGWRHVSVLRLNHKLGHEIAERRRSEASLRATNQIVSAVGRAQFDFLSGDRSRIGFDVLLETLLEASDSDSGFIGEVFQDANGNPYLRIRAINGTTWDDASCTSTGANEPASMKLTNLDTLFGTVIREREVVLTNDPANDPRRGGLPDGHPPLKAFLGMPFLVEGEIVGMAGVANRAGGYDLQVVEELRPIVATCGLLIQALRQESRRKRISSELRRSQWNLSEAQRIAHIGGWDLSPDGGEMHWSTELHRILGRPPETVSPSRETLLTAVHADDRDGVTRALDSLLADGRPYSIEHRIVTGDGRVRAIHAEGQARFSRRGRILRLVGTLQDVTESKQALAALRDSEQRLATIYGSASHGILVLDLDADQIVDVNPSAAEMLGYRVDELTRLAASAIFAGQMEALNRFAETVRAEGQGFTDAIGCTTRSGVELPLEISASLIQIGERKLIMALVRDITARLRADQQLRLWANVFGSSRESIFITDRHRRFISVNQAFTQVTGYSGEELTGCSIRMLASPRIAVSVYRELWRDLRHDGVWQGELWGRRKNGQDYPLWLSLSPVKDQRGRVTHYIGLFTDITARKEAEARVEYLAHHDVLTGLPNRALLMDRLEQALAQAQRSGTRVAVMFLDLDKFKTINDSLGHVVGDKLLQAVAQRLRDCVRDSDTVCRQGGDEFLLIVSGVKDERAAARVAEKTRTALAEPHLIDGIELRITPSVGISIFPTDATDGVTLIKNADAAMYYAKSSGRNAFRFFTADMNTRADERLALENSLRGALAGGEFVLHYQPQVSLASRKLVGFEALIRWRAADGRLIPPATFIPVAEECGLILAIGTWVVREACRQNRDWQRQGMPAVPVAVNVSASQFQHRRFQTDVAEILRSTGLSPEYLELELTEQVVMHDAEESIGALNAFKAMGARLAIDDFGVGYSSLSYLRRFPVDRLKIDQSFARDLPTDRVNQSIVTTVIGLGRGLGLEVVAEGVENEDQLTLFSEQQCHIAQGHLFSPPLPADEIVDWYRSRTLN